MHVHSTPSEIGARAEAAIARALIMDGKQVYIPLFSAHARADLVFEDVSGLHRVQCKTSRVIGDVVWFRVCSNTNNEPKDYRGQIDFFGVFSPELDEVYLVPVADVPLRAAHLRVAPPRNGQRKGIRWAADYRIGSEERAAYDPRARAGTSGSGVATSRVRCCSWRPQRGPAAGRARGARSLHCSDIPMRRRS